MAAKFFQFPFGTTGNKTAVPDTAQGSGAVSWQEGWGPDYERDPATDAQAKRIPRDQTNQLMFDITNAIRQYQLMGVPEFVPAALNGGTAVPYVRGARVVFTDGLVYVSLADNNTALPTSTASWMIDLTIAATVAEVRAGAAADRIMTPQALRNAGDRSFAGNGYWQSPDGYLRQWGSASSGADGSVTVTFPRAFPNGCLNAQATNLTGGPAPAAFPGVTILSASQMVIYGATASGVPVGAGAAWYWSAEGY